MTMMVMMMMMMTRHSATEAAPMSLGGSPAQRGALRPRLRRWAAGR
jgi:hypothetical protein